ncbi:hypothetical protein Q765_01750 [Flavobacterium rivuli WB 3.3-2 = DSM 21788]|uniref:DUF1275 domain-containing protein n=1 Tax=Flavobacterium rivuli WB 3.3-2 = DSM 21788 TaxID=1121895 RepID=A0A0A2MAK5_9FLAO|nr:YoaK family protein [Flavobacterium rivuli]KGO88651.1 hypothetical protein Q765_01750 [Flavobacterium rivuli WB 3.3-2 = DSM 21788]
MAQTNNIGKVTMMLTAVAGYCDTATFVAGDNIFSAHVTGNFITFAYQMITGSNINSWVKLLTFPVFIIAVIIGGRLSLKAENKNKVLLAEAIILIIVGILAFTWHLEKDKVFMYTIVMMTVFALGLQNAYGKLYSKETYGPTTMMTGNVTQASLDFGLLIAGKFSAGDALVSFKKQMTTIIGFLAGCILGALLAREFGLASIILPGFAMLACYFLSAKPQVAA